MWNIFLQWALRMLCRDVFHANCLKFLLCGDSGVISLARLASFSLTFEAKPASHTWAFFHQVSSFLENTSFNYQSLFSRRQSDSGRRLLYVGWTLWATVPTEAAILLSLEFRRIDSLSLIMSAHPLPQVIFYSSCPFSLRDDNPRLEASQEIWIFSYFPSTTVMSLGKATMHGFHPVSYLAGLVIFPSLWMSSPLYEISLLPV